MTARSNVDSLVEMIDACSQQALFLLDVYPARAFSPAKKYGVPTARCDHPGVRKYLDDQFLSVREALLLRPGEIRRLNLAVWRDGRQRQTLVFEWTMPEAVDHQKAESLRELEFNFRSLLLRLNAILPGLADKTNVTDAHFKLELHVTSAGLKAFGNDERWGVKSEEGTAGSVVPAMTPIFGTTSPFQLNVFCLQW